MRLEIELKVKFRKSLENGPLGLKLRVGKVPWPSEYSSHGNTSDKSTSTPELGADKVL